jgi:SAM-dependent methyltransferase
MVLATPIISSLSETELGVGVRTGGETESSTGGGHRFTDRVDDWLRYRRHNLRTWYYLAAERDYAAAYRRLVDHRVRHHGAMEAVGGEGLGIGRVQLSFLQSRGLEPGDRLLDLGWGAVRAGRYLVEYLEPGDYYGMDISAEALANVGRVLAENGRVYATYLDEPRGVTKSCGFGSPEAEMEAMAEAEGFRARTLDHEAFPQPRGQRMLELERDAGR